MKKRSFQALIFGHLLMLVLAVLFQAIFCSAQDTAGRKLPPPKNLSGPAAADEIIPDQYIVRFSAAPLSIYRGGVPGLPATSASARGKNRLEVASADSKAYLQHLQEEQGAILRTMEKELGRSIKVIKTYKTAYNGVAVKMSAAEARRIARLAGIAAVIPDKMRQLHTDNGPQWIGADDIWGGVVSTASKGEGVVVGVIDTGINPANASFADVGGDGYHHSNPRGRFYGFCDPAHPDYNIAFDCNNKLIGAYDFTRTLPTPAVLYDNNGHGSHTASTAAGNVVNPAAVVAPTITINRPISGVAPHSNIISYKACIPEGCPLSALVAAIDQATTDGVDVINYSIGGSATDPWNDADSEAFLNARQAGVFVAASAGNSGPSYYTVGSPGNSPWLLTVGNSSHDRSFANTLTSLTRLDGTGLANISGRSVTGSLPATSIVYAGNYGDPLCPVGAFAPDTFTGQIVVCDRGSYARVDKGTSVLNGGAGGMVLANDAANSNSLNADAHVLPAVHITYTDGVILKNWLGVSSNHQAAIAGSTVDTNPVYGDIMVSSSSLGPNAPVPSILKPDVSAPGLDILAANGTNNATTWGMMTGTSMASPHAAGAAALLISLHPDWTPAEVQSALTSTADPTVLKYNGITPVYPFDSGTGRVDVSQAASAGFVLDETYEGYLAADPSKDGDPKALNIASLGRNNIVGSTTWTRTLTSTASSPVSWTATVTNPTGVTLTVDPANFTLNPGATQQVSITADASGAALNTWLWGSVLFTPSDSSVAPARFPVILVRVASVLPSVLRYDDVKRRGSAIEKNLEVSSAISDLTVTPYGLVAADVAKNDLYQDPTPSTYWDPSPDPPGSEGLWAHDGLWVKKVTVPADSKRLVAEILATDATDMDLYIDRWTGSGWVNVCASATSSSIETCSVSNPVAGDYYVYVQNWLSSDPSGTTPDTVELATAVVPGTSAGNLTVALAGGGTSVPAGQPFDLNISWSLGSAQRHWYGRFGLGTDAGNPENLGLINLDLHVKPGGLFFPIKGKDGKTTVIQLK